MSIYPVKLSDWYPPGDDKYEITSLLIKMSRCIACDKKLRWKSAIGHHSIPWGHGDIWCSNKCLQSGKKAKRDKRRERREKRKLFK